MSLSNTRSCATACLHTWTCRVSWSGCAVHLIGVRFKADAMLRVDKRSSIDSLVLVCTAGMRRAHANLLSADRALLVLGASFRSYPFRRCSRAGKPLRLIANDQRYLDQPSYSFYMPTWAGLSSRHVSDAVSWSMYSVRGPANDQRSLHAHYSALTQGNMHATAHKHSTISTAQQPRERRHSTLPWQVWSSCPASHSISVCQLTMCALFRSAYGSGILI